MVERLKTHGGPDLLCDAHFLPLRENSFDAAYSAAVTEHLANPFAAAQETFRVLKPGGLFLSNSAFMEPWHDSSYFHLSPLGCCELLRQAGFVPQAIWPEPDWLGYDALMRMGNRGTQTISLMGRAISVWYGSFLRLRDLAKTGRAPSRNTLVADYARVSGSISRIARKPLTQA